MVGLRSLSRAGPTLRTLQNLIHLMRTVPYGVIGLGFFGEYHAQVAAALPNVELRALASRQDKRRKQLKQRFGAARDYRDYRELLADPEIEAVSVVTHV